MLLKLFYKKLLIALLLISLGMFCYIIHYIKNSLFFENVLPNVQLYLLNGYPYVLAKKHKICIFKS